MLLHYQQKPTISEQIIHENTTCEIVSGVQKSHFSGIQTYF